jgi:flavodoxin I
MKSLIIYDSFFGNTEKIAQALGQALGSETVKVQNLVPDQLVVIELLILGSPTRAFSPSPDIKNFLKSQPSQAFKDMKVTAFDTRLSMLDINSKFLSFMVKIFGYASGTMVKTLQKKGGTLVVPPEWFLVKDSEGPLKDGELERATEWAKRILAAL